MQSVAKKLDQFYTSDELAFSSVEKLPKLLKTMGYDLSSLVFLEPSAGDGVFVRAVERVFDGNNCSKVEMIASDLDPHGDKILKKDFLLDDLNTELSSYDRDQIIVVGNPPFGKRANLAIGFIEKSFEYSDTVCFILPLQFRKYLTQERIRKDAVLLLDVDCPKNSFVFEGKPYNVRCCFQVWSIKKTLSMDEKNNTTLKNLRKVSKTPTFHPDFEMYLYNCTENTKKYFGYDWDFCVQRQGWSSFVPILSKDAGELSRKVQWMFFKASDEKILKRLLDLDFEKLADMNTSVRGFGKSDVVEEYMNIYA